MRTPYSRKTRLSKAAACIAAACSGVPLLAMAGNGVFTETGNMVAARGFPTVALMANGKVLVAGGTGLDANGTYWLNSAEVYDPALGTFTPTGSMHYPREEGTATLLPNGKVLMAGGNVGDDVSTASAEIYDPATGVFSPTATMSAERSSHAAVLLPNGKVLVAGGTYFTFGVTGWCLNDAQLFDPATNTFTQTGNMSNPRCEVSATVLSSGKVLVFGSDGTADLYDPGLGTFTPTGPLNVARTAFASARLNDGRVLVAGGWYNPTPDTIAYAATAEVYDPATGRFTPTGNMRIGGRSEFTATTLPNGAVLIAGGMSDTVNATDAELYDPTAGVFMQASSLLFPHDIHGAIALTSGQALILGGNSGSAPSKDAELFSMSSTPPVATPTVTTAFTPSKVVVDGDARLTITLSNASAAAITNVAFTDIYPTANTGTAQSPNWVSAIINTDNNVANTCGGTVTLNAGATTNAYVRLANGTIPANGSCAISVNVEGYALGGWSDPTGLVTSFNAWANPGDRATPGNSIGTLTVVARPVIKCQPFNTCS